MYRIVKFLFFASYLFGSVHRNNGEVRIFGGQKVTDDITHSFVVSIQVLYLEKFRHICGASVITPNFVVSAAHCFGLLETDPRFILSDFWILAGTKNLNEDGERRKMSKVIIHENYASPLRASNDISLITFDEPLPIGDQINIVKIAPENFGWPEGDTVRLIGWGKTEFGTLPKDLLYTDTIMLSKSYCLEKYGNQLVGDTMECAGEINGGKDACEGDSGGPAVHLESGYLVGIVSWGIGCGEAGNPGVYTKLTSYNNWIRMFVTLDY